MKSAGSFRERVSFYSRVETEDGYGNTVNGFSEQPELTCSASITPKMGGESVLASRLQGTNLLNIVVRKSRDTDRIELDWRAKNERTGVIYNIRSKIDPMQNSSSYSRVWELLCEEGVVT